ncbi:phospholipase D-like domain-containing protein [Pseudomonas chlororaphis]|uniref:phospholipase D-like domain-containing protein n=1 Tax=Pseudomonas chlororaphis TaxID=587753 RepID=UPI000A56B81B|nr:phospholipase D-like domain-containing protein [Pseudomonas chlororaphis]
MTTMFSSVYVKVPFCHGQHKFKILKGRRWGVVDHLLLQEIAQRPASAHKLSEDSGLPRRLIIEIIIPFMRIGWVQLTPLDGTYVFEVTQSGLAIAAGEELPMDREPITSIRQFLIDPTTGKCHRVGSRLQNFQVYKKQRADEIAIERGRLLVDLHFDKIFSSPLESDIYESVAEQDEDIVGYEEYVYQNPYFQTIRYVIAKVDSDFNITGIPSDTSSELKDRIIQAAQALFSNINTLESTEKTGTFKYQAESPKKTLPTFDIDKDDYQLILGATQHQNLLHTATTQSISRLIIHSTFINPDNLEKNFDAFIDTVRRGVQIDILWGQVEPDSMPATNRYQETIQALYSFNERMRKLGLGELFHIHTEPTGSHAKIIMYDGVNGFSAALGSCNWLASGFNRFEASIMVNDSRVVVEVAGILSQLARGLSKTSTALSRELAILTKHLADTPRKCSSAKNLAKLKIVLNDEHHAFVRRARDEAKNKIFICSHRISNVADRPIITPLKSSTTIDRNIEAKLYYGTLSGGLSKESAETLSSELAIHNISLEKISHPTIHAKILSWDLDDALISSLNWLSASASGGDYDELGIYIHDQGITERIQAHFLDNIKHSL